MILLALGIIISFIYCHAKIFEYQTLKRKPNQEEKNWVEKSNWNFLCRFSDYDDFSYFHNHRFYFHQQNTSSN